MKRDMNLIRDLLLFYESDCSIPHPAPDDPTIDEHLVLMVDGGLLAGGIGGSCEGGPRLAWPADGRNIENAGRVYAMFPLTWAGHDFLAAARDQKVWNKAMTAVGGMTFEIIKEYLKTVLRQSIGMGQ